MQHRAIRLLSACLSLVAAVWLSTSSALGRQRRQEPIPPAERHASVDVRVMVTPPCEAAPIRRVFLRDRHAIERCADGAHGYAVLRFDLQPGGRPGTVWTDGSLPERARLCLARRVANDLVFPENPMRCEVAARLMVR